MNLQTNNINLPGQQPLSWEDHFNKPLKIHISHIPRTVVTIFKSQVLPGGDLLTMFHSAYFCSQCSHEPTIEFDLKSKVQCIQSAVDILLMPAENSMKFWLILHAQQLCFDLRLV